MEKLLKYPLLIILFMSGITCSSNKNYINNPEIEKKNIYERMKSKKNMIYDTIRFNNFLEYLLFIPNLKLPVTINSYDSISTIPDTIKWFLQSTHCNYGPYPCNPLAKIEKEKFVSILYTGKTSGNELLMYNYNYKGKVIDSAEIYVWEGMVPIKEQCKTTIDLNLNIHMQYSAVQFESFGSIDTFKISKVERAFKILNDGKIQVLKNKSDIKLPGIK